MTNKKKIESVDIEEILDEVAESPIKELIPTEKTRMDFANEILEKSKGQVEAVLVLGVTPSGDLIINTNVPEYPFMHYIVNRTQNELWAHENENRAKAKEQREKNG